MRLRRLALTCLVAVLASAAGCGGGVTERDQWTVWITTDVPVPNIVDRALVEILDDSGEPACADCRRILGLPASPSSWPLSFGVVVPPSRATPRIRVRLHLAARVGSDGIPPIATTIDRVARLPPARGNTEVAFVLPGECIGVAASPYEGLSCSDARELTSEQVLQGGRPESGVVPGTWPRSAPLPCALEPEEDMVCIPGGFFVLGDPIAIDVVRLRTTPERFVTISPFMLDREEVKVGAVRDLVVKGKLSSEPQARSSDSVSSFCTYLGRTSTDNDTLPVNCIDHTLAEKVCAALGKRLPTEAEWEWAAGNLEEESAHPWGSEGDPCSYSDVGLGHEGFADLPASPLCRATPGRSMLPPGVPREPNARDQTRLGVLGLGGGLSEWTADRASNYDEPCWRPEEPFLEDPRCDSGQAFAIRGPSWIDAPGFTRVSKRQSAPASFRHPFIGLRCARSQ